MQLRQTKSERDATRIANKIVKALLAIESFQDDPAMIFNEPVTVANPGATEAWKALKFHYIGE